VRPRGIRYALRFCYGTTHHPLPLRPLTTELDEDIDDAMRPWRQQSLYRICSSRLHPFLCLALVLFLNLGSVRSNEALGTQHTSTGSGTQCKAHEARHTVYTG
jgi:hypothetical protein